MAAVVSLGQTAQYTPCSNLIQEIHRRAPSFGIQESKFWARWEKLMQKKIKGNSKRRKGKAFFLKKETHGMFGILSQIEHPRRCKLRYFLSRGQNTDRCSVPAQKIRGLLESSLHVGRYFQPRAFTEFPARQEIAQIRKILSAPCVY